MAARNLRLGLLFAILALGFGFRLYEIDQPYVDLFAWREASTAMMAKNFYRESWDIFFPQVDWGGEGPNYQGREFQLLTYLTALSYCLFGVTEWVGRVIVALFGVLGIFSLFMLVQAVWDRETAFAAAAVLACLPGSIFLGRSFMPDQVMTALVTTGLWLMAAAVRRDSGALLLGSAFFWTLGTLVKLQGLVAILPLLHIWVTGNATRRFRAFNVFSVYFCGLIVLASYYVLAIHIARTYPPYHLTGEGKFLWSSGGGFAAWLDAQYFLPKIWWQLRAWLFGELPLALMAIGLFLVPRRTEEGRARWTFHLWLLGLAAAFIVEAKHFASDPQNLAIFLPIGAAFAGRTIVAIAGFIKLRAVALGVSVALVAAILVTGALKLLDLAYMPRNESYRTLGMAVKTLSQPRDLVVSFGLEPMAIYFADRKGWVFPPAEFWSRYRELSGDTEERVVTLEHLRHRGAKWLILTNRFANKGLGPLLEMYLQQNTILMRDLAVGRVFRFKEASEE